MADIPVSSLGRLDSWKAIAAYLKRDIRTVRRWERQLGLPVRRVPGGRGVSVFAYAAEIEAWLQRAEVERGEGGPALVAAPATVVSPAAAPPAPLPAAPATAPRLRWFAVGVACLAAAVLGWIVADSRATEMPLAIDLSSTGLVGRDVSGAERWRYAFPAGQRAHVLDKRLAPVSVLGGTAPEIVAGVQYYLAGASERALSGELLALTPQGTLRRRFAFDDRVRFSAGEYDAPWGLVDYRIDESHGERRVAVVAHHYTWWPSLVSVLDDEWRRAGTFVHAGWIERVHWTSPDRLVVAGFSQPLDGGMVAILDTNALDGQTPGVEGTRWECQGCAPGRPIRYILMPRSEVNRASAFRFNRARLEVLADRIVVRAIEWENEPAGLAADILYEFTPSLRLMRASHSEMYWQMHRSLEAEGKIDHSRQQCPDRDGPAPIRAWEPASGWTTVALR